MINKSLPALCLLCMSTNTMAAPAAVDTSALQSGDAANGFSGIGYTVSSVERPFVGIDRQTASLPYVSFRYERFYVEGLNIGLRLAGDANETIELLATPRFYEVKAGFASGGELSGIETTHPTYLAGFSAWKRFGSYRITAQWLSDTKESDGSEAILLLDRVFEPGAGIKLLMAVGVTRQDSKLVDHFYGVQQNEVQGNRPAYAGASSLNPQIAATLVWKYSGAIELIGTIKAERLGSGITNSPIIDQETVTSLAAGFVYRF